MGQCISLVNPTLDGDFCNWLELQKVTSVSTSPIPDFKLLLSKFVKTGCFLSCNSSANKFSTKTVNRAVFC